MNRHAGFSCAVIAALASTVWAFGPPPEEADGLPPVSPWRLSRPSLALQLQLTPRQRARWEEIDRRFDRERSALRRRAGLDPVELRQRSEALETHRRQALEAALTPAQRVALRTQVGIRGGPV